MLLVLIIQFADNCRESIRKFHGTTTAESTVIIYLSIDLQYSFVFNIDNTMTAGAGLAAF